MKEYATQMEPFNHQRQGLAKMKGKAAFALLMAMRTGKTKVTLDDFGWLELNGMANDLLVIAPAGVYITWEKAFREHASLDLINRTWVYIFSSGSNSIAEQKRREKFLNWDGGPRFLLVNIEALSSVKRAREFVLKFLSQRISYSVVDESVTIKNPDSERSDFVVMKLGKQANWRRILTGLPTPRSPLDLYAQFRYLDPGILGFDNYVSFTSRYAKIQKVCMLPTRELVARLARKVGNEPIRIPGIGKIDLTDLPREDIITRLQMANVYVPLVPLIRGYKHEEELRDKIAPHSFRVRLEDCYDMPPKVYMPRYVTLTKEQKRIYEELKNYCTSELADQDFVTATEVITRILRLHQVLCGHTKDEEGKEHLIPENRTNEVLDILAEYDGKAIIWCSYDIDVNKIANALKKEYGDNSVARFWGGNKSTRESEEARFKNDDACRFMIATPAAGGRGRTWDNAHLMIYYSSTNNLDHRSQSEERASATNKMERVAIVDLIVPGTVDEAILKALREKINLSDIITGDNWKQWVV